MVSRTALVVDDDGAIRAGLREYLEQDGFRAVGASDGREALRLLEGDLHPDVILLDLLMPGMDGWDFRAAQMAIPALAGIPVVIITATGFSSQTVLDQLHAQAHLAKPLDLGSLGRILDRICQRGE